MKLGVVAVFPPAAFPVSCPGRSSWSDEEWILRFPPPGPPGHGKPGRRRRGGDGGPTTFFIVSATGDLFSCVLVLLPFSFLPFLPRDFPASLSAVGGCFFAQRLSWEAKKGASLFHFGTWTRDVNEPGPSPRARKPAGTFPSPPGPQPAIFSPHSQIHKKIKKITHICLDFF